MADTIATETTEMEQEALAELQVDGLVDVLSDAERAAALEAAAAGALRKLSFRARTFVQGPNRNFLRFYDQDMPALAASFTGTPFLRDHDTRRIESRDGTVRESAYADGAIVQAVELTTTRGIQSFLEGQIDRFSIGWHYDDAVCSVCGHSFLGRECTHWPGRSYEVRDGEGKVEKKLCELYFVNPRGKEVSAVNVPAVAGTGILGQLCEEKENLMKKGLGWAPPEPGEAEETVAEEDAVAAGPAAQAAGQEPEAGAAQAGPDREPAGAAQEARSDYPAAQWLKAMQQATLEGRLAASRLRPESLEVVRAQFGLMEHVQPETIDLLIEQQRRVEAAFQVSPVRNLAPGQLTVETEQDRYQAIADYVLGVKDAPLPPPNLRSMRDLYLHLTGDYEFYGRVNPELAAATTVSLPALVLNALNKVLIEHHIAMSAYRWYESVAVALPHDGSTQEVKLISMGGISDLPVVPEGAAYTEKTIADQVEAAVFTKYGAYVGITLEMIRRNDLGGMQWAPRRLMQAAITTRSATVARIFTMNAGTGPTLNADSKALFHADHNNVDTAALDSSGWAKARLAMMKQTELGSGKRFGYLPKYLLVPVDLYDTALQVFSIGTGSGGLPGTPNNDVNIYGTADQRPHIITVPDWTDATDWAYMVDPSVSPVIQIGYANLPAGGKHPLPEIFTASDARSGLMFSNDTLAIKIRDWWGYGVATHLGIGKMNVAG